eukprot:1354344-Amphidinium_carterae.1
MRSKLEHWPVNQMRHSRASRKKRGTSARLLRWAVLAGGMLQLWLQPGDQISVSWVGVWPAQQVPSFARYAQTRRQATAVEENGEKWEQYLAVGDESSDGTPTPYWYNRALNLTTWERPPPGTSISVVVSEPEEVVR